MPQSRREDQEEGSSNEPSRRLLGDLAPYVTLIVIVIGGLASAIYFVATTRTATEQMQRDYLRLETEIHQTQMLISDGLGSIRKDIAILPDQRAKLDELDRRLNENQQWRGAVEARINEMRDVESQLRSKVESMERASNANLGRR